MGGTCCALQKSWGAREPWLAQIESISSQEVWAARLNGRPHKKENNTTTEKPEKTKTSNQKPTQPRQFREKQKPMAHGKKK